MTFPLRRSTRGSSRYGDRWHNLSKTWRQQHIDLSHCRISKCTSRLIDASDDALDELRSAGTSFVALAVSATGSASREARGHKERYLLEYVRMANERNLPVNDDYGWKSSLELAAYHGLCDVLALLLEFGSPLRKATSQKSAVFWAIKNGQHAALDIMLSQRRLEARRVLRGEATGRRPFSSLMETIVKGDTTSAKMLLLHGCALMSNFDAKFIFRDRQLHGRRQKLERLLHALHPTIPNVMHWRRELHWSFPQTDRETLNWLWSVLHHPSNGEIMPDEMWSRVFSFFGRGWFALRIYDSIGYPGADVLMRNIIGPGSMLAQM